MAKWLVHEAPVQFLYGDTLSPGYIYYHGIWVEGTGYFTHCSTGKDGRHGIGWLQLDGVFTQIRHGQKYEFFRMHYNHQTSGRYVWCIYDEYTDFANQNFKLDTILGDGQYRRATFPTFDRHGYRSSIYSIVKDNGVPPEQIGGYLAVVNGRLQRNTSTTLLQWEDLTGPLWDPQPADPDLCVISKAPSGQYYIIHDSGRMAIYDHLSEQLVRNDLWIDDFHDQGFHHAKVSYCQEHDFFVAICKENLLSEPAPPCSNDPACYRLDRNTVMRIYLNRGYPAAVSTPLPTSPPVKIGVVNEIWVKVTGAQDDPVVGHLVDWAITSGEGQLTIEQSETDDDGIARTGYLPPSTFGGSVTIQATVKY